MRGLIIIVLACLLGYGVLHLGEIAPDNYVKIYIFDYVIEMSVIPFLLLLLIVVVVLYCIIRIGRLLFKSGSIFSNWRNRKTAKTAQAALGAGYLSLIKGDWSRAEKSLTTKVSHSGLPYVNYLAAAQAAQEQGKLTARDDYLNAAYKIAPQERFAIGLIKAKLHQKAGQLDQSLATLEDIGKEGSKNSQYTAMLLQTYQQLGDWSGVQGLLSIARKQKALPERVLNEMYHNANHSMLSEATDKQAIWDKLSRGEKKHAENVALYAKSLITQDEHEHAEKIIRVGLKETFSDVLVAIYGAIETDKPEKLRRNVEGWLLARPENAELNLAAGRFALSEKNIELAQDYLGKSIALGQVPLAYSLLGKIYEDLGNSGKALQLYREGMVSASRSVSSQIALDSSEKPKALAGDFVAADKTAKG